MRTLTNIEKIIPNVKQQHQVWRYYLNAWSFNGDKINCFDKEKNSSFITSTTRVAKQQYAYEQPEFTQDETEFISLFISNIKNDSIRNASYEDLNIILFPAFLSSFAENNNLDSLHTDLDYVRKNYVEQVHGFWEEACKPIINKLREAASDDCLPKIDDRYLFNYYLADQLFRTSKTTTLIKNLKNGADVQTVKSPDGQRIFSVRSSAFCYALSYQLVTTIAQMLTYESYNYHILKARDISVQFITCDQPVYFDNYGSDQLSETHPVRLHYPISPKICLCMDQEGCDSFEIVNNEVVQDINSKTVRYAERFVFSSCTV